MKVTAREFTLHRDAIVAIGKDLEALRAQIRDARRDGTLTRWALDDARRDGTLTRWALECARADLYFLERRLLAAGGH